MITIIITIITIITISLTLLFRPEPQTLSLKAAGKALPSPACLDWKKGFLVVFACLLVWVHQKKVMM